jgi:hypothetical protein
MLAGDEYSRDVDCDAKTIRSLRMAAENCGGLSSVKIRFVSRHWLFFLMRLGRNRRALLRLPKTEIAFCAI